MFEKKFVLLSALTLLSARCLLGISLDGSPVAFSFEDASLSSSDRTIISIDLENILQSFASNVQFEILPTNHVDIGQYTGTIRLTQSQYLPRDLRLGRYSAVDGTNIIWVSTALSSNYIACVQLTNRYSIAIQKLPEFLAKLEGMNPANTSLPEYAALFWRKSLNRPLAVSDDSSSNLSEGIQECSLWHLEPPSVLSFKEIVVDGNMCLTTQTYCSKTNSVVLRQEIVLGFISNAWRIVVD